MSEIVLLLLLLQAPAPADAVDLSDRAAAVASRLVCYCGTCSNKSVQDCTCGTARQAREEIRTRLQGGESAAAIIAFYTGRYGEQILIAPTKRGFNLIAWVTPFVALLLAGAALLVVLRRRSGPLPAARPAPAPDPELLARLERELREGND